jgi:hypothetical protein
MSGFGEPPLTPLDPRFRRNAGSLELPGRIFSGARRLRPLASVPILKLCVFHPSPRRGANLSSAARPSGDTRSAEGASRRMIQGLALERPSRPLRGASGRGARPKRAQPIEKPRFWNRKTNLDFVVFLWILLRRIWILLSPAWISLRRTWISDPHGRTVGRGRSVVCRGRNSPNPGAPTIRPWSAISSPRSSVFTGQPVTSKPS